MIVSKKALLVCCGTFVLLFLALLHQTDSLRLPFRRPQFASEPKVEQKPEVRPDPEFKPEPNAEPEVKPEAGESPSAPIDDGVFRWKDLAVHYPLSQYEPIPQPQKYRLATVQSSTFDESQDQLQQREKHRADVKQTFQRCWNAYRERAWLQDELAPISGGGKSTFGGWAASLVDTLDTIWIMDLKDEFSEAVNATLSIDFSTATFETINVFETTIRYLGGLLAAYDLSGDSRLLDKSVELGDMLYVAFDTPNRMPVTRWKVQAAAAGYPQAADESVLSAEIGSLSLEFTRLSQITNDPKWYDAIHRITAVFEEQQNSTNLPGMWPLAVNARDEDFASGTLFTLGAMADSMYEYLPKMHALLGGSDLYERLYRSAMTAAENSLFRPMLPDDADVLIAGKANVDNSSEIQLQPEGQHLVCFTGGMYALGGRLMQEQGHVDIGRKITDGCIWTYEHSELGIMPEVFTMVPCDGTASCMWNESRWHAAILDRPEYEESSDAAEIAERRRLPPGFVSMNDRRYILRPEAIESVFILYRVTGDHQLQDKAWNMWTSIKNHTETEIANAAISDMSDPKAPKTDSMESFWMAETLKYFYLVFSEPSLISLDEYVFNTEAHPFKRPKPGV